MDQFDIELNTASVAKTLSTHLNCLAKKSHRNMERVRDSGADRCAIQIGAGSQTRVTLPHALFPNPAITVNSSDPADKRVSIEKYNAPTHQNRMAAHVVAES